MLVDANLLIFAFDDSSPFNRSASDWLTAQLNGSSRIGLPWQSLVAFVRITTNPRASRTPVSSDEAWTQVEEWLDTDVSWIPGPTARHGDVLGGLIRRHRLTGNMITDAVLAALAIEHGLRLASADTDFARFDELSWENPLAP
jgi:toxin-antitoxin system PIN domain toxin